MIQRGVTFFSNMSSFTFIISIHIKEQPPKASTAEKWWPIVRSKSLKDKSHLYLKREIFVCLKSWQYHCRKRASNVKLCQELGFDKKVAVAL